MKQCPKCSKEYPDDAGICLQDDSPLVFAASNNLPVIKTPPRRCLIINPLFSKCRRIINSFKRHAKVAF